MTDRGGRSSADTDGRATRPVGGASARVLVTDDSRLIRAMVGGALRGAGYLVDEADGGPAAVQHLNAAPYDVVVTDLNMPRPDGFEILETVRQRRLETEVIILTGTRASDASAAIRAMRLGAHDYLAKPLVGPEQILLAVERALSTKRQREALRAAEARYRQLFNDMPIGLFRIAPDGRFLDANPALVDLLAFPDRAALLAANARDLDVDPPERQAWRAQLEREGAVRHLVRRLRRHDGRIVWVEETIRAQRDAAGAIECFDGSLQDVSVRKAAEEELREAQRMEAVGRLAGGVAHDFNNLLGIIVGAVDLLGDRLALDDGTRADVAKIRTAAERAASLTRQLLAFGRRQVLRPRVLDLNQVIRESEGVLSALVGSAVKVEMRLDTAPALARVDPGQLQQVIMSLASNAREAMPGGGRLVIETSRQEADGPPDRPRQPSAGAQYARLSVADTGKGMDEATRARVFEPYFTTKGRERAAGLGLATVHGIVAQSGGYVTVESDLGKGTRFDVFLPLESEAAAAARPPAAAPNELRGGHETILLVEDEDDLRTMLRRGLARAGYNVLEAADGRAALEIAAPHLSEIAVVVTDLAMPRLSGLELAARLRVEHPRIAVLFITGHTEAGVPATGPLAERCGLLHKPFTLETLTQAVREVLDSPARASSGDV